MTALNKQALRMRNYLDTALKSGVKLLHLSTDELEGLLDENLQLQRDKDSLEAVAVAMRDDMRDAREKLEAAEKRNAELEARTVTVKLPELCVGVVQDGHAVMVPYAAGHWFNKTAILEMLTAAGIGVKGE